MSRRQRQPLSPEFIEAIDANAVRREEIVRRFCAVMGWEYKTAPVFAGLRKVAAAEAVALGLDKAEEILKRLEADRETLPDREPQAGD